MKIYHWFIKLTQQLFPHPVGRLPVDFAISPLKSLEKILHERGLAKIKQIIILPRIMSEDDDMAFAMFLQEQFDNEDDDINQEKTNHFPTSLVDDAWEMIDPAPDIRQLFLQFNDEYFYGLLGGVEVRWSPRMTLCAGLCCYEGRGGLCSIRLSEPLLKLRPRKDLVETLLHEMIHALLFVTQNNKDHDGHGPEFHKHMYRINKQSGTNITVYHNFHDEVNSYRLHWWKCNGPCQKWPPFYGVVKRSMNRAPAPRDTWWDDHKRECGGEFTKIKEPENYGKKKSNSKTKNSGAGSSKEKDHSPSLPTFFDKMKTKKLDDVSSQAQNVSKERVEVSEIRGESCDEDLENPAKKLKTEAIIPFNGVGHVLGSSKSAERSGLVGDKTTLENQKEKSIQSNSQKTLSTDKNINKAKNRKKYTNVVKPELTIIDAFKRSNKSQCGGGGMLDAPEGSQYKPISLCEEDSPGPLQSLPPLSSSSCDVSCPVCLVLMPIANINAHLDNCLRTI